MSTKEGSQRQVNKKLVKLLLTEAEETGAIFTENNASFDISTNWESIVDEEILQDEWFDDETKCRTCSQYLMLDDTVKDLNDKRNVELLHQIKTITGVWIKTRVEGLPHHICENCQEALKKAIEFRDNCIEANAEFSQAIKKDSRQEFDICDDEIESELENVLYEESSQYINKASGMGLSDLEFGTDNEDDFLLHKDKTFPEKDILSVKGRNLRENEHICREIASITKCKTKEEIGKVDLGAEVYKVVLTECNRDEETKKKPKYSLAVPKRKKPKRSLEEIRNIRRLKHLAKPFSYVCDKCGHSFRMPDQLQMHLLRHNQTKNFACPECPKKFYNSYLRNMHLRVWHRGEKPWACNHCSETFSNANCRQRHEKEKHGVGPRISMNRCSERSQLKGLKEEETKDGRYHCKLCTKTFSLKRTLAWHMNSHTGERPLKCKVCNKGYAGPAALRRHEMTHDKLPFHCEICLKGFLLHCQLKEHQVVHTGERPYWCETCDIYYRFKRNLDKHNKSDAHKNKVLTTQAEEIEEFPDAFTNILSYNTDFHSNNVFLTQDDEIDGLQLTLTEFLSC